MSTSARHFPTFWPLHLSGRTALGLAMWVGVLSHVEDPGRAFVGKMYFAVSGGMLTLVLRPLYRRPLLHVHPHGVERPLLRREVLSGRAGRAREGPGRRGTGLGQQLRLRVVDDGQGPPDADEAREGVGLVNTRARLDALYGDYVRLHTHERTHLLRKTMKEMEQDLDPSQFLRIHRSTIVNVDCLRELRPYGSNNEFVAVLTDCTERKLSRTYRDTVDAFFNGAL